MDERLLMIICIGIVVIGVPLLGVMPVGTAVSHKQVEVRGIVERVYETSGITIAYVRPATPLPVVLSGAHNFSLGEWVVFNGTLAEYGGRVELIVD